MMILKKYIVCFFKVKIQLKHELLTGSNVNKMCIWVLVNITTQRD